MKKRKLKKIIKESVKEAQYDLSPKKSIDNSLSRNDYTYTEASDDTKKKIRNLIIRLSKNRDSFDFNINEYSISFYSKSNINKYFNIDIIKEVGFNIHYSDKRVYIKDLTLYDEMVEKIKKEFDVINLDNFNELYSGIMKENGLSRESNLDDLLSNI